MSKDNKASNVESLPDKCAAEGCKGRQQRMHFCNEHFGWYKEGLLNKKGQRPTDFDKKYQHYLHKKAA
jgi:hypothetical protein